MTILDEDVFHRLPTDWADVELFQFTENPGVCPTCFPGDHHHQLPHDGGQTWSAFSGRPFAFLSTNPTAKREIADDGDDVPNGGTEFLAQLQ